MELRYEIVRVLNADSLIDAESYERRYRARNGDSLEPGVYLVLWNDAAQTPAFDEFATYIGPYRSSAVAMKVLDRYLRAPERIAA